MDYSLNLIDLVQRQLSGDFVGRMSSFLGETNERTRAAVNLAVPGMLAGFDDLASTDDGARRFSSAVDDADQSLLGDLGRTFGKDIRSQMNRGTGILQSLLGIGGLADLNGRITGSSGISSASVTSLLGLLAPIVLGVLRREKISRGLDSRGLALLLASQRNNIADVLPESMGQREVLRERVRENRTPVVERAETYREEPARHSWLSWALPLALLAGLIGLIWAWTSRPPRASLIPPSRVEAGREPVRQVPQYGTPASFERLKMKYRSVIDEASLQGVRIDNMHEQNGKLILRGTAPSAEAVSSVMNAARKVNPKQDDIIVDLSLAAPAVTMPESTTPSRSTSSAGHDSETYTVKAGDTLGKISNQFYGDSGEYMRILDANRDQIAHRDRIEVGQELRIPR